MIAEFLATKNNKFLNWLNKVLMHCDIDPKCHIPKSIKFSHGGRGIVIGNAKIGENVHVMHNVTIGNNFLSDDKGFPEIGKNVKILTGSLIIGNIKIGDNSIIGAGTFVNKNVPANSIAYNGKQLIIKSLKMKKNNEKTKKKKRPQTISK